MLDPSVRMEFRRRAITEAMAEICAERGYRAASIAEVTARAATSRGMVYSLYRNREDIFLDLLDRTAAELLSLVEGACASTEGGFRVRIEAALGATLGLAAEKPAIFYTFLVAAPHATPTSLLRHQDAISDLAALLRTAVPNRGALSAQLEEITIGGLTAVLARRAREGRIEEAPALLADFVGLATAPYLPARTGGDSG